MRLRTTLAVTGCLIALLLPSESRAQWTAKGVPVCASPNIGELPLVASDGSGGCYVAWVDDTDGGRENPRAFIQHLAATGRIDSRWASRGLTCCTVVSPQVVRELEPDGSGGVFVLWTDARNPDTVGVYVTRITAGGAVSLGWPTDGLRLTTHFQNYAPKAFLDGHGGLYVSVEDERNIFSPSGLDLYLQHVDSTGKLAAGWPADGKPIAIAPSDQDSYSACRDPRGGFYFVWGNTHTGVFTGYAQHLNSNGDPAPGWPSGGKAILSNFGLGTISLRPDGAVFATAGRPGSHSFFDGDFYSVAFDSTGALIPAFAAGPKPLAIAAGDQRELVAAPDGSGGLYAAWVDNRDYFTRGDAFYLQHLDANGVPLPGWVPNGIPVILGAGGIGNGLLVTDSQGGVYTIAQGALAVDVVWAARRLPSGAVAPSWAPFGEPITTSADAQDYPSLAADDRGGAFVAYESTGFGKPGPEIFVQHLSTDAPVAVDVSLVSTQVRADDVELDWFAPGSSPGAEFTLERATGPLGAWSTIAAPQSDGTGHLRFDDQGLTPSTRYGYRLGRASSSGIAYTSETWLSTPPAARFALTGARPNPAPRGHLQVAFVLPSAEPASLELYDLGGRRVATQTVGVLGAGEHVLELHPAGALDAGIYWLRLSQGTQRATTRVVVAG